jgi:DNA-binding IclR family transcriptional regulator
MVRRVKLNFSNVKSFQGKRKMGIQFIENRHAISAAAQKTRMTERPRKTKGVNAVNRALTLLDVFLEGGPSASLAELTKRTRLVKPTVLRLLLSLEGAGYVVRLSNGQYQLGAKVMQLGTVYRTNFALDAHVLPVLRHLADVTKETASFHVKEGNKRLCLFRVESPQQVRVFLAAGTVHPMDDTASGLVLQTYHAAGVQTPSKKLIFQTSGIRDAQTASLSTPVFGDGGKLVGALTVTGPTDRFNASDTTKMGQNLTTAAGKLSRILGAKQFPT